MKQETCADKHNEQTYSKIGNVRAWKTASWLPWKLCLLIFVILALVVTLWFTDTNNLMLHWKLLHPKHVNNLKGNPHVNFTLKKTLAFLSPFGKDWTDPRKECSCEIWGQSTNCELSYDKKDIAAVKERRKLEYEKYQKRNELPLKQVIIAEANSPLSYPSQGVEVKPLYSIVIPGLGLHETQRNIFTVTLKASQGVFNTIVEVPEDSVHGSGEKEMTITSPSLDIVNAILKHVTYTSTVYHINSADLVHFQFENHEALFSIAIRQPPMPHLFDPGPGNNINNLVTVTTKTFLRYNKLQILINSIHQFYPNISIIIADDSANPEKIEGPNIEQYFMPFAKGWFAGRNLVVSQVTTKYLLWVDDDFLFTTETKIEKLVDVLENTNLDLVGGSVNGNLFRHKLWHNEGNEEGGCLFRQSGIYRVLDGFPKCGLTSVVVNFFLARTDKLRSVGFDPLLSRTGHTEAFIDGLGRILVGSCSDVVISHQSKKVENIDQNQKNIQSKYRRFRGDNQVNLKHHLFYFKNRLKCSVFH